jgi:hypothetical protein
VKKLLHSATQPTGSGGCVNKCRSADLTVTTAISTVIYLTLTVAIFALLGLVQKLVERL